MKTGLSGFLPILLLAVARDSNQEYLAEPRRLTELLGHLIAVNARQADVQQHYLRQFFPGRLECRWPIVGEADVVALQS